MFESPELFKFAVTQGGLTLVCLVLFWWITREHKKQDAVKDERQQILVNIVEKNTVAVTTMDQTCQRLARSLERPIYTPDGRNAGAGS